MLSSMRERAAVQRLSRQELLDVLERERAAVQRERLARRYAAHLMTQLAVAPHGIELVCHLASPLCRDNAQALARWVGAQLADPEFQASAIAESEIALLLKRLEGHLSRLQAANA